MQELERLKPRGQLPPVDLPSYKPTPTRWLNVPRSDAVGGLVDKLRQDLRKEAGL